MTRMPKCPKPLLRAAAIVAAVCLARGGTDSRAEAAPTFATEVAPILHAQCAECHRPNQAAPMSLLTYQDARPWAKSIRNAVADRSMPPWFADPAHGDFANERRLSEEEIATIVAWADAGAPLGDPSRAPAPPEFEDDVWRLGTPDLVLEMPEAYAVPDDLEDEYEVFRVPTGLTEDKWIAASEVRPGDPSVVHHVLVFVGEGFEDGAGSGMVGEIATGLLRSDGGTGLFAKYAPGGHPEVWPPGTAKLLRAGADLLFQVHYHKEPGPGTATRDRSSIALRFAEGPVERPITTAWLVNPTFEIAPGDPDERSTAYFMFLDDGWIYGLAPHMHLRGTSFKFTARYPDGERETLLSVPDWDFNWQTNYLYREPKRIPRGTVIRAEGRWDNSAANPHNPDPTATVRFGEETTDEMMIGFMDYAYESGTRIQAQVGLPGELDEVARRFADDLLERLRERRSGR